MTSTTGTSPAPEREPSRAEAALSSSVEVPPTRAMRWARLGPALSALATFALHAACWGRYGLFRDELYYLVCGQRLSAGYVDQPPGIAVVAGLAHWLFGAWVPGLRSFAWVAAAATVYLTGRLAARISGSGVAATLAAVGASSCLLLTGTSHMLLMNAFEPLLVLAVVHVLVRLTQGGDPKLWVAAGGLAGLAVLMKYTAAPLVLALLAGIVITPARRTLRTPWALAGAGFGFVVVLPNLAWQASHGFPFLEIVRAAVAWKNTPTTPLEFLVGVLVMANLLLAPLWVGGLCWLLLAPRARAFGFIGVGGLVQLLALTFGHGKPYYATALLPPLLAGGAAAFEALVHSRTLRWSYAALFVANAVVMAPLVIPLASPEVVVRYLGVLGRRPADERSEQSVLPQYFADDFGWRELTAGVARVYHSLPPEEQARVVVFTKNYGVASALEILGPEYGLPRGIAVSGHNQFWFWGVPAGRGDSVIVVHDRTESCGGGFFREQVLGEQLPRLPFVMPFDNGHTIWICRGASGPIGVLWPSVRHFD